MATLTVATLASAPSYAVCVNSPNASGDAALAYSVDGNVHLFQKDGAGFIYHRYGDPSTLALTYDPLGTPGSPASSKPVAVSWGSGHVATFVRGANNAVYYYQIDNGSYSGWQYLGGSSTYNPTAVTLGPGHMMVFARGSTTSQGIWYNEYNAGAWSGWIQLGGWVTSSPTAVSWGSDHVAVFYRGNDGRIWYTQRFNGGSWAGGHFGAYAQNGSDLTAVSRGPGLIDLLYKGNDGHTWHSSYSGGYWGGSTLSSPFGGSLSEPGAVATTSGELVVFVRGLILKGANGNPDVPGLYKRSTADGGASWSGYINMGDANYNNPEAVAVPGGGWVMARQISSGSMQTCTAY